jgi:hypothetical protein
MNTRKNNQVGRSAQVRAEVHSDDHVAKANFDAAEWFRQASDREIIDLSNAGWSGDYPADAVAEWMRERSQDVDRVFAYIEGARSDIPKNLSGFEVSVDEGDAILWLKSNRPELYMSLS